jgi:hypothetical protein
MFYHHTLRLEIIRFLRASQNFLIQQLGHFEMNKSVFHTKRIEYRRYKIRIR